MQTADEITSACKNLRYYKDQIDKLAKQQFQLDCKRAEEIGINTDPGTVRFDSLGAITSACSWIETYTLSIEANLDTAIKQDKYLPIAEEPDSPD